MNENYIIKEISGIKIKICKSYNKNKLLYIDENVNEAIKSLPENLLNHLRKNNFEINIVSKKYINYTLESESNNRTKMDKRINKLRRLFGNTRNGCYRWGELCIYVSLYKNVDMQKVILHEIGHFIDYKGKFNINCKEYKEYNKQDKDFKKYKGDKTEFLKNENIEPFRRSFNNQFLNIYYEERDNYKKNYKNRNYYKSKYSEHFAESFSRYCINSSEREELFNDFKKTFQYIKKFIEEF
jgi:hypothetical protein